jgi:sugar phosphate permease
MPRATLGRPLTYSYPLEEEAMTSEDARPGSFYGNRITLLMVYMLFFTAGLGFYTFQVFVPKLVEAFGWSLTQTQGAASVWAVVYGLSGFFVGSWIQRFGARKVIVAGTISSRPPPRWCRPRP